MLPDPEKFEVFDPNAPGTFKMSRPGGITSDVWESPAGLKYAITEAASPGTRDFHTINHILTHGVSGWKNPPHTVFAKTSGARLEFDSILPIVDDAWGKKAAATLTGTSSGGNQFFRIPMGKVVGMGGEESIIIFVKQGTSEIQSAFACTANFNPPL